MGGCASSCCGKRDKFEPNITEYIDINKKIRDGNQYQLIYIKINGSFLQITSNQREFYNKMKQNKVPIQRGMDQLRVRLQLQICKLEHLKSFKLVLLIIILLSYYVDDQDNDDSKMNFSSQFLNSQREVIEEESHDYSTNRNNN